MRWEKVQLYAQQTPYGFQPFQRQQAGFSEISLPGKRWGHTCNAIKGGRFLYVFGGYGKDNCQTNQVHVFDTAKETWSQPVIKGIPPTPRDSHSCTVVGENLFVFGGTDGLNPLKDLHILETSTLTWITPNVRGEGPEAREGHNAALVGKRLFIFGGCGKSAANNDEIYYNDLYILNTETFVWKRATTSGTPPSPRDSHTCSSWRNKVIVIGGEDGHDYYLSDVHILDADTLTWKELYTSGQMLTPRAGHSTVAFGKNLFVFGGFTDSQNLYDDLYMLDVDSGIWTKVMTTGEGPSARFSMAGDCLDPLRGGVLVFIGGCNKNLEALDDMYYLYTGLVRETLRDDRRLEKLSLRKQLKLKCQEQYLTPQLYDKALVRIETTEAHQHTPLSSYGQPRVENFSFNQVPLFHVKKSFQAKVMESFPHGYTIETIIDGKPLRGVLFANKPGSIPMTNHNPSRKRASGEVGDLMLNGDCNSKAKSSRSIEEEAIDNKQTEKVNEEESMSCEKEAANASEMKNQAPSNAPPCHKELGKPEAVVTGLNLNDDGANEAPDEIVSTTAKDLASLFAKQVERTPTVGEHSDSAKSI